MAKKIKPNKRADNELNSLLDEMITIGNYVFKKHARQRQADRMITDIEVLDILDGRAGRNRHRNKSKDKFDEGRKDWNYCIEGMNLDGKEIRIIISFEDGVIPIITVMWI